MPPTCCGCWGRSCTTGDSVWVPGCAVYLAHRPPTGCVAPLRPGSTGLAAHVSRDSAVRHAVFEVLERHLVWHAWDTHAPRRQLSPEQCRRVLPEPLREGLTALGRAATFLELPGRAGCPACWRARTDRTVCTRPSGPAARSSMTAAPHHPLPSRPRAWRR
ncbi:YcaO-like family protein [Streptomyces sp. CA-250714]|uniref:YcaO-like family protein n=1 Tax=Streptomyces sp. CA-250714 TaxID=3240060 RepID=UPI003D94E476